MRVPVASAVIYVVSTAEECQVVKTSFDYEVEGSEPARIDQYRIFAMADTGAVVSGANDLAAQNGTGSPDDDGWSKRWKPDDPLNTNLHPLASCMLVGVFLFPVVPALDRTGIRALFLLSFEIV